MTLLRDSVAARLYRAGGWISAAVVTASMGSVALVYRLTDAPPFNPPYTIDPWLYTSFFVNFDFIYPKFAQTYYGSRLPWIVPGRIFYAVLPIDVAYWGLHGLYFLGGVALIFVVLRRFFGWAPAVAGAICLAGSQLYWNAQVWDYLDGATQTYLLAALCLVLTRASGWWRIVAVAAGGAALAAAITSNLFAIVIAVGFPILYIAAWPAPWREGVRRMARDLPAFIGGAAATLVGFGAFARFNGGPFFYFMPQVRAATSGVGNQYKVPGYSWMEKEPRLLAPLVALVVAAIVLAIWRRRSPAPRVAVGIVLYCLLSSFLVAFWEFFANGNFLEYTFYFSYFTTPIALAFGGAVSVVLGRADWGSLRASALVVGAALATLVPLFVVFRSDASSRIGVAGLRTSAVVVAVALALLLVGWTVRRRPAGLASGTAGVLLAIAGAAYAVDSSYGTYVFGRSTPYNDGLYHTSIDLVGYARSHGFQHGGLPVFWYDAVDDPLYTSVQSIYFYSYSYVGLAMPKIDKDFKSRMELFRPKVILMLCDAPSCRGGVAALAAHGYAPNVLDRHRVDDGNVRMWIVPAAIRLKAPK